MANKGRNPNKNTPKKKNSKRTNSSNFVQRSLGINGAGSDYKFFNQRIDVVPMSKGIFQVAMSHE